MLSVKLTLTFGFIAAAIVYVRANLDAFLGLSWPSPLPIVLVASATIVSIGLRSAFNALIARRLGAQLTFIESFMLSMVTTAGNSILPVGVGAGLRALYMKRVHDFPVSYFASGLVAFALANVFLVSIAALLLLAMITADSGQLQVDLAVVFLAMAATIAIGYMSMSRHPPSLDQSTASIWRSFAASLRILTADRRLTVVAVYLVAANFLVASLSWTAAIRDYTSQVSVLEAFLLSASQIVSGFVTLTPGAAGFQELAAIYAGRSFSVTTVELFAVLLWVRATRIAVTVIFALPSALVLRGRLR